MKLNSLRELCATQKDEVDTQCGHIAHWLTTITSCQAELLRAQEEQTDCSGVIQAVEQQLTPIVSHYRKLSQAMPKLVQRRNALHGFYTRMLTYTMDDESLTTLKRLRCSTDPIIQFHDLLELSHCMVAESDSTLQKTQDASNRLAAQLENALYAVHKEKEQLGWASRCSYWLFAGHYYLAVALRKLDEAEVAVDPSSCTASESC